MARQYRVVDHIVEHLAAIDVTHIFGVDGANIEDLYDAAHFHPDITAVLAKHEFSAATMADGYSRSGAGLGVVAATAGGGALNVVPGLGEALASRVPVLALIGQPSTALDGLGSFQDLSGRNGALNAEALFSAVSVYCHRVTEPADIVPALSRAIAAARSGGPAVLLLPKNIQQAKIDCTRGVSRSSVAPPDRRSASDRAGAAARGRAGHDHRRRAGGPRRRARRARTAARDAACPGRHRAGREGRRGHAGPRLVVGAGRDGRDGSPRRGRSGGRQRAVPPCRHPAVGHCAGGARRGARFGAHRVAGLGGAVRSVHARPHRRPSWVVGHAHSGSFRGRPAGRNSGPRFGAAERTDATAVRRARRALPRRDDGAGPECSPTGSTSSWTPATPARPRSTICRCGAAVGSSSRWAWAAWGTASARASAWRSAR